MLKKKSLIKALAIHFAITLMLSSNQAFAFIPFFDEDTKPNTTEVGLTGGVFKLSPDLRSYGTQKTGAGILSDSYVLKNNPKYRLGGGIDIIYGSAYKINAIYFETENKKTKYDTGIIGTSLTPPAWHDINAANVSSTLNSRYRFATVSVSNPFTLNCFTLTPSVGLSYLYLKHNQSILYNNVTGDGAASPTDLINLNSKFQGFGPTFAANFGYEFCGGFSVLGALQYSPLIGDIKGSYNALRATNTGLGANPNINVNLGYKTQSTLVGHTQSELGFGYNVPMNKCFSGNITFVYRFVKITGARETNLFTDDINPSLNNQITNTVLHGPLLRFALKYKM